MSLDSHLKELQRKHQELDAKIASEHKRPAINDLELKAMKRSKLRLKEEIERMRVSAA